MWAVTQRIVPRASIGTASGLLNGTATWFGSLSPTIIGICIALSGGSYAGGLYSLVATTVIGMLTALLLMQRKL
jgi:sugar phosphate permease